MLHLQRGTPYVYQGEELGMTNAGYTEAEQYADIESVNFYRLATAAGLPVEAVLTGLAAKSRDNARTPVQWTEGPNAGFTSGRPWLPVNANHVTINADAARADAGSVFHHYRRLIGLRHDHEVVREGRFELLLPDHEQIFAYTRTLGDQVLVTVAKLLAPATPFVAEELYQNLVVNLAGEDRETGRQEYWILARVCGLLSRRRYCGKPLANLRHALAVDA